MKTYLITTILIIASTSCAHAQGLIDGEGLDGTIDTPFSDGVYVQYQPHRDMRPRYIKQDRLSQEEYNTRVLREQARQRHIDNGVGRDDSYTELYDSNNRWQENQNTLSTIDSAAGTIRDIANTVKYLQNLF